MSKAFFFFFLGKIRRLLPKVLSVIFMENVSITDNPFYTDIRYNDKIYYNDNFTVTNPSLKR